MNSPNSTVSQNHNKRSDDLLPNEEKVSYDELQIFFEKYKYGIIASIFILLVAIAGLIGWTSQQSTRENLAHERLAASKTPEALKAVIQDFPKSNTALLAEYQLANQAYEQGRWEEAIASYKKILEYDPNSTLVPSAIIGQGAAYESIGKRDEALKSYQSMATAAPKSFQAPQAKYAAGRLLESGGKLKDAQKEFEDLIANYPKSSWRTDAETHLKKINLQLQASAGTTSGTVPVTTELPKSATPPSGGNKKPISPASPAASAKPKQK